MPKKLSRYNEAIRLGALIDAKAANGQFVIMPYFETEQYVQGPAAAASYAVSTSIFVNDGLAGTYVVSSATASFGTASSSGTLQVEVATGTQAIGSGTNQLASTVSLSGTANTPVFGTLATTLTPITAGSRLNLIFAGTVTGLANAVINVSLQRIA